LAIGVWHAFAGSAPPVEAVAERTLETSTTGGLLAPSAIQLGEQTRKKTEAAETRSGRGMSDLDYYRRTKPVIITAVAMLMAIYFFWIAVFGMPEPMIARSIFVSFVLFLGFLGAGVERHGDDHPSFWRDLHNWVFALLGASSAVYVHLEYDRITSRLMHLDPLTTGDWTFGIITTVLVLELTRRTAGNTLVVIVAAVVGYTVFGQHLPGPLRHQGLSFEAVIEQFFVSTNGLYGSLTSLALAEVFMFIMFGAILMAAGGMELFTRLAEAATRRARGGPAKASVLGSAMFGAISGSGVANVYATGSMTIPLMQRVGFRPQFAAATEAVSSALGQLIPPIMGAAAFIIAQYSRTAYIDVAAAALIPAFLYIFAVYTAVHLETNKQGIGVFRREGTPAKMLSTLRDYGHLLLPIALLVYLLVLRYSAYFSATMAVFSIVFLSILRPATRMSLPTLLAAIETGIRRIVSIASILLSAGLAVAALTATGTVFAISAMIINLAQGNLLAAAALVALTTILLGMGLPPVGAFLIAAVFGAPALVELGVPAFSAYMFIFMFSVVALITPPICLTSFAAASIARADFMKTGVQGFLLALPAYLIPFIVIFEPLYLDIFSQGIARGIVVLGTALVGIISLSAFSVGYLFKPVPWALRIGLLVPALTLLWPGVLTDILGISTFAVICTVQYMSRTKSETRQEIAPTQDLVPTPNSLQKEEKR
jgi:TRAP transporter 4TM/12TM fusion protein